MIEFAHSLGGFLISPLKTFDFMSRLLSIADIIRIYGLSAKHQLSQNFILDKNVTDKIVRYGMPSLTSNTHAIEIGPGPGLITRSVLERHPASMAVVEKDERFLPVLNQLAGSYSVPLKVVIADILKVSHQEITPASTTLNESEGELSSNNNISFIGNLPFGISTALLLQWCRMLHLKEGVFNNPNKVDWGLIFQDKVADRIVASPSTSERSRLSVMTQAFFNVKQVYFLNRRVFVPIPEVDAALVYFKPRVTSAFQVASFSEFEHLVRLSFHKKRKTLNNNLKFIYPNIAQILLDLKIPITARAEDLTVEEFGKIADILVTVPTNNVEQNV